MTPKDTGTLNPTNHQRLLSELAEVEQWDGTKWDGTKWAEPDADVTKPSPEAIADLRRVLEHPDFPDIAAQANYPYIECGFWGELNLNIEHGKHKGMGPNVLPLAEYGHNKLAYVHSHFPETDFIYWVSLWIDAEPNKNVPGDLYTNDVETVIRTLRWVVSDASEMFSQKHFPHPDRHPLIFIDPDINYGHPTVEGYGIKAEALWRPWDAGDRAAVIASWFGVPEEVVEAAIEWCQEFSPEEEEE